MIGSLEKIVSELKHWRETFGGNVPVVVTSGGFDPLHVGHVRCIRESSEHRGERGLLIVVVNGDSFLMRKKGKVFMPLSERVQIIDCIRGVDHVVAFEHESDTVVAALEALKPSIFTKGGDRSSADKVPEFETCEKLGCKVLFGVGGTQKVQSSSALIEKIEQKVDSSEKKEEVDAVQAP